MKKKSLVNKELKTRNWEGNNISRVKKKKKLAISKDESPFDLKYEIYRTRDYMCPGFEGAHISRYSKNTLKKKKKT